MKKYKDKHSKTVKKQAEKQAHIVIGMYIDRHIEWRDIQTGIHRADKKHIATDMHRYRPTCRQT